MLQLVKEVRARLQLGGDGLLVRLELLRAALHVFFHRDCFFSRRGTRLREGFTGKLKVSFENCLAGSPMG